MDRAVVALAVLLVAAGGVYAYDAEIGPFADPAGEDNVTGFPGAEGGEGGDGGNATTGGSDEGATDEATAGEPAFAFRVSAVEECGQTCRDVTAAIHNTGDADASGVTVYSRIYVGNSTATDDRVWSGRRSVGALPAAGSDEATQRVEFSLSEGYAIRNAGGWITVLTQVESDQRGVVTFEDRYQVG